MEDEYLPTARQEVIDALAEPETEYARTMADRVFNGQCEEHVGYAYMEAVSELDAAQRTELLLRAAKGAFTNELGGGDFALAALLSECDDRAAEVFLLWARLPIRRTSLGEISAFVFANMGLGKLGKVVVDGGPHSPPDEVIWCWMGVLIRAAHASFLPERRLFRHFVRVAARALGSGISWPFAQLDPFYGHSLAHVSYAFSVMGDLGDSSQVKVLLAFVDDSTWGPTAIVAIRRIRLRER